MESQWERGEGHVHLGLEEARKLLSPWRVSVHGLTLLEEGHANTNYRIETQDGPRVLRLHQRHFEKLDLSLLAPPDVRTPERIFSTSTLSLYQWIPGVSLQRAIEKHRPLPYEKIARDLAQARLSMNRTLYRSAGFFDTDRELIDLTGNHDNSLIVKAAWPSAIEGLLGWLRHLLPGTEIAKEFKARITAIVDDAEPRLQAIAGPPVLAHGDFKPSNLLVDETGLTAVLDWEFTHAGTWLSDVGQLLRHSESLPSGFVDTFLEALDAPADTMILARTLDLVNLIDFLHRESGQPIMRSDVESRIAEVCEGYESRFGRLP